MKCNLPYTSESYKQASYEKIRKAYDGCGIGTATKFLNMIMGINVLPACIVHDYEYYYQTMPKEVADINFYRNLIFLIQRSDKSETRKFIARQVAYIYYLAVKYFGKPGWKL